jgi:hypothetical protein
VYGAPAFMCALVLAGFVVVCVGCLQETATMAATAHLDRRQHVRSIARKGTTARMLQGRTPSRVRQGSTAVKRAFLARSVRGAAPRAGSCVVLHAACCELLSACCVLRAACCELLSACCELLSACCELLSACCELRAACRANMCTCSAGVRAACVLRVCRAHEL